MTSTLLPHTAKAPEPVVARIHLSGYRMHGLISRPQAPAASLSELLNRGGPRLEISDVMVRGGPVRASGEAGPEGCGGAVTLLKGEIDWLVGQHPDGAPEPEGHGPVGLLLSGELLVGLLDRPRPRTQGPFRTLYRARVYPLGPDGRPAALPDEWLPRLTVNLGRVRGLATPPTQGRGW